MGRVVNSHASELGSIPAIGDYFFTFVFFRQRACLLRAGVCQAVLWGRNIQPNQTLISMINYYDKTQLLTKKNFPPPSCSRLDR